MCKPFAFLSSRESEYYPDNREIVEDQCEYIMNTQLPDRSWEVNWSWEKYHDEWAISKNWWKGQIIIDNLFFLKGFGKI